MDANDPNYPIPFRKLGEYGYPGCTAKHYQERKAGRLPTIQMGARTFVLKKDADAWLQGLPKVNGKADPELDSCVQSIERVAKAVNAGRLDRQSVLGRLRDVVAATGLMPAEAA
jgi:hypothetical protein